MNDSEKMKILNLAKNFSGFKDRVGQEYISSFKYLKSDLSSWFNSLTVVCFSVGAIALTFGADKSVKNNILYPGYFWLGAFLLIFNGVLIFWYKKLDIEQDFSELPGLRKSEADFWKAEKILTELANGDDTRLDDYRALQEKFVTDYTERNEKWSIGRWIVNVIKASMTDITFGLLLFPILLMSSQFIDVAGLKFGTYIHVFILLLILYLAYSIVSASRAINDIKEKQNADKQIEQEVSKRDA